jgi:RimJ/RimL family protein N-acetyltransferase
VHSAIAEVVVHTRLENGQPVCLRTVRPDDAAKMRDGIAQLSAEARYLRFFSGAPTVPDKVVERLVAVDGHRHLAWGAILSDDAERRAIGVVHAVRQDAKDQRAEFAVGILDAFHGQGLARMLTAVLLIHCRHEGIAAMDAQVLEENRGATGLVMALGGEFRGSEDGVADYTIAVDEALRLLEMEHDAAGLPAVFTAFADYR